ncbi:MAG: NusG domain II-containing protein [Spirochaetia bacterium]|nr:NusG domain II-containing protein [Spirochaetia bacterium]
MKLSDKPTFADYLILALAIALTLVLSFGLHGSSSSSTYLDVQCKGNHYLYSLDKDKELTFTGLLGPTTIEIKDGKAAFIESPCKNKICIKMGWISRPGQFAACLPNGVLITIKGKDADNEVDDVAH